MKKMIFTATILLTLGGSALINNVNACSKDGYVGPNGTSCLYWDASTKCYMRVEHHRAFFGLFQWNTVEVAGCDKPSTDISASVE
ncbi:hypothetical protein OF897_17790 [Chryseobacterium formosus]|uniref:Uncharacterized protein n=1 Tax=Chryseobacterium formosus TaxID=1537363 RepID=A0ABT3XVR6_9FLAO|nr:hypothetical protein [Chryseobacterium formosus]MCX8525770.1 hypothetical protein [Chryseobacterium formosus]